MMMADATVLIVDDEPELLEIFSIWLHRNGAAVLKASNGAEALKVLTTRKVDALISDIRMPVMDGVTLVKTLHDLRLSLPTVIFVSGFGDVSPRTLYSLGVEALLAKPLGRNQLLTTLEASLREREERWLHPSPSPAGKELRIVFPSLTEAIGDGLFHLGRGGFCVRAPQVFPESPVDFYLEFNSEDRALEGQGIVRWCDAKSQRVGVEFLYLTPKARDWVLAEIESPAIQCFIPSC